MRRLLSEVPMAQDTYTRPKWRLLRFVSIASHCLSKTDEPLNGVRATRSSRLRCVKFHAVAVVAPWGLTATPRPDRGRDGLMVSERKKCSPLGRYVNMYGS